MSFWHAYFGIYGGGPPATVLVPGTSVYYAVLEAVQDAIQGIGLEDVDDENVQIAKVLSERETVFPGLPGILLVPLGSEQIVMDRGTNCSDDIGYPVGIVVFDQDRQQSDTGLPAAAEEGTQDQEYRFNQRLYWREQLIKEFINQRLTLSGVSESVFRCTIEPMDIIDVEDWFEANLWRSQFVVRCWVREQR